MFTPEQRVHPEQRVNDPHSVVQTPRRLARPVPRRGPVSPPLTTLQLGIPNHIQLPPGDQLLSPSLAASKRHASTVRGPAGPRRIPRRTGGEYPIPRIGSTQTHRLSAPQGSIHLLLTNEKARPCRSLSLYVSRTSPSLTPDPSSGNSVHSSSRPIVSMASTTYSLQSHTIIHVRGPAGPRRIPRRTGGEYRSRRIGKSTRDPKGDRLGPLTKGDGDHPAAAGSQSPRPSSRRFKLPATSRTSSPAIRLALPTSPVGPFSSNLRAFSP